LGNIVLEKCVDMHGSSKSPPQNSFHKTMKSFFQFLDRKLLANNYTYYYISPGITDFYGTTFAFMFSVSRLSRTSHLINICTFFFFNVHGSVHRNNFLVYNSNWMHK